MRLFVQIRDSAVAIDELVVVAKQDKGCIRLRLKNETSILLAFDDQEQRDLAFNKVVETLNEIALKQLAS